MLDIIGKRKFFYIISGIIILAGIASLLIYGLNPSIDFSGGSRLTIVSENQDQARQIIQDTYEDNGIEISSIQESEGGRFIIRSEEINQQKHEELLSSLDETGEFREESFETIGPTISREITFNAFRATAFASLLIVLYIAWSFRTVPQPLKSWRFGICAVIALVHDVLIVLGVFSLLGHFFNVEIDSLFVTAVLTIIGFSVHDTIVVFDRIRENAQRVKGEPFEKTVNTSILQTLTRSLNTSLTVILVLFTLLLFGGETLRWFVVALLIGITTGTYSSIFNASALLVDWEKLSRRKL